MPCPESNNGGENSDSKEHHCRDSYHRTHIVFCDFWTIHDSDGIELSPERLLRDLRGYSRI